MLQTYILSNVIFVVAALATLPQLYQTISTGLARDINLLSIILNLVTNGLLALHGFLQNDIGLVYLGTWFAGFWGTMLFYKLRRES